MQKMLEVPGAFASVGTAQGFRSRTTLPVAPMVFLLNQGGMGDYINYTSAFAWLAEHCPWIQGTVYSNGYLIEFLELVLKPYPTWKVRDGSRVEIPWNMSAMAPEINVGKDQNGNDVILNHQLLNATGAHLVDLGFAYYANISPAPVEATLPHVTFHKSKVPRELRPLEGKYVVFTPGALVTTRMTSGRHINPIIDHCIELGLTPVFLGKAEFQANLNPKFADDVSYEKGIDLRNKTTVCQAGAIMERAFATLGLDNGLLHLAACTSAPVIFGYNIVKPQHRAPRRKSGLTIHVSLTDEQLACNGCQSRMKMLVNHSFHKCLYGDVQCIDLLFADGARLWKNALDSLMKESQAKGSTDASLIHSEEKRDIWL